MTGDNNDSFEHSKKAILKGDQGTAQNLLPLVYNELRTLARARINKLPPGQTLQPTALVHEAYLRIVGSDDPGWNGRGHFFGAAAQAMRDVLVEEARRKSTLKRGQGKSRVELDQVEEAFEPPSEEVLAVHEALKKLEKIDPKKAQIVNLRYFARLSTGEAAEAMNVSTKKIQREWRYIQAWLERELQSGY